MASKKPGRKKANRAKGAEKGQTIRTARSALSSMAGFQILENSYYGVLIFDLKTFEVVFINSKLSRTLGYKKSEIEKFGINDIVSPEDQKRMQKAARARLLGKPVKTGNRYSAIHKSGKKIIFDVYTNPVSLEGRKCLACILNDVSNEIRLENDLKESERKYRSVVDNIADGIAVVLKNRFVYTNFAFSRIFGYKSSALEGKTAGIIMPAGSKRLFSELEKKVWQSGYRPGNIEAIGSKKDGSILHLNLRASRIKYEDRNALQVTVTDITAEKIARENLEENEERFRKLVEGTQYGFFIIDLTNLSILYLNDYARKLLGSTIKSMNVRKAFEYMGSTDRTKLLNFARDFKSGRKSNASGILKMQISKKRAIWLEYQATFTVYQGKKCCQGMLKDITELMETNQRLRESEERFREMAENIREFFWIIDRIAERTIYVSPSCKDMFGLSRSDFYDDHNAYLKVVHPEDKRRMASRLDVMEQETDDEYRIFHGKSGELRWLRSRTYPIRDKSGRVYRTTGIVRDITERKRWEEELRKSEARYRAVVEDQTEFIDRSDPNTIITFVNEASCRYFNTPKEDFIGKSFLDFLPAEEKRRVSELLKTMSPENPLITIEHKVTLQDGDIRWHRWTNRMIYDENGKPQEMLGVGRDITEQKLAEQALRESELKFRAIFENTSDGIAVYERYFGNLRQKLMDCNESYAAMSGRTKAELLAFKDIRKIRIADGMGPDEKQIQSLIENGKAFTGTYSWKRPDGEENYIEFEAAPVILGDRIIMYTVDRDITDRKYAEEDLRASEQKYRNLYESMMDGFATTDMKGRILEYNAAFQKMLGYSAEEISELRYQDITPSKWHDFEEKILQEQVMTRDYSDIYEKEYIAKSGRIFPVELRTYLIRDEDGKPAKLWAIVHDITDRRAAADQVRESEEKYRSVVNNIGIGIALISPKMEIISFNRQMQKWFPKIAIEDKPICYQAYNDPPKKAICSYCPTVKTLRDGQVHEAISDTPIGEKIVNYKIISSPIKDKNDNVTAAIEVVEDVTERKRAEEEIRKFKTISDRASYGTVISDMDRNIIYCNEFYAEMHGMTIDALIGKDVSMLFPPEEAKSLGKAKNELMKTGRLSAMEIWHQKKDGTIFPTLTNAQIITDDQNKPLYISATAIDITEKKKAEVALKNQRDMLRDVTGHVIKIQEDERRRISMELHDSIGQSLSVTKLQIQNLLKKMQGGNHNVIQSGLESISNLVSDTITDLRQISANLRPVILDNLGLWPTIEWYLKDFGKKADLSVGIDIEEDMPGIAPKAEVHVFRVIQEIMINIQKHSKAKNVSFKSWAEKSRIVFEVTEDGGGFDPEAMFQPSERKRGMGLINIMERVKIVRGKLDIRSENETGSKFVISIPILGQSNK
jgi:PAS domain S-box-containing protein